MGVLVIQEQALPGGRLCALEHNMAGNGCGHNQPQACTSSGATAQGNVCDAPACVHCRARRGCLEGGAAGARGAAGAAHACRARERQMGSRRSISQTCSRPSR